MKSYFFAAVVIPMRIVLPALFACGLATFIINSYHAHFVVGTFGVAAVLFNYGKTRCHFGLSFLLSVMSSYAVFYLAIAIFFALGFIVMGGNLNKAQDVVILGVNLNALVLATATYVIAPLLMFRFFNALFDICKTPFVTAVKRFSVGVLIVIALISPKLSEDLIFLVWQIVLLLALQLMLYQNEIKALFRPKLDHPS